MLSYYVYCFWPIPKCKPRQKKAMNAERARRSAFKQGTGYGGHLLRKSITTITANARKAADQREIKKQRRHYNVSCIPPQQNASQPTPHHNANAATWKWVGPGNKKNKSHLRSDRQRSSKNKSAASSPYVKSVCGCHVSTSDTIRKEIWQHWRHPFFTQLNFFIFSESFLRRPKRVPKTYLFTPSTQRPPFLQGLSSQLSIWKKTSFSWIFTG